MITKRQLRQLLLGIGLLLGLFLIVSVYIYVTAPVEQLRDRVTYTPLFKDYTRQAGLGLSDNLTMDAMTPELIIGTLVSEDHTFVTHDGVNPVNTWNVIVKRIENGKRLASGSTLTQQLAKNLFTNGERTLWRKYVEMLYAIKIERYFTKAEIFTLYINIAQTGTDMFGYENAAQHYFGKRASALTPVEAIFIIDLLPAPEARSAWYREHTPLPSDGPPPNISRLMYKLRTTLVIETGMKAQHQNELPKGAEWFANPILAESESYPLPEEQFQELTNTARSMIGQFIVAHGGKK